MEPSNSLLLLLLVLVLFSSNASVIPKTWLAAWNRQSRLEEHVDDINTEAIANNFVVRRLIVMPLTDDFCRNIANQMHGKVQYSDRCSLPASIGTQLFKKPFEAPWIFEVRPVRSEIGSDKINKSPKVLKKEKKNKMVNKISKTLSSKLTEIPTVDVKNSTPPLPLQHVNQAYLSPLDFRAPENYIFMPQWLMDSLNVTANSIVELSFVRVKLAGLVVLQPMTTDWDDLIEGANQLSQHKQSRDSKKQKVLDATTILEHEINKYASLTAGTVISIVVQGKQYPIYVKETRSEDNISSLGVRIQDSDVRVDIDRTILDSLIESQRKSEKKK